MIVLGLETSTRACSVAVSDGAGLLATMTVLGHERPSDQLLASVERCLQVAGLAVSAVEGIAVSAGPGSFTGLRIGVTAAKTLAYVLGRPVVAVSSLDVLAANVPAPRWPLWVLVDARKEKLYAARYEVGPDGEGLPCRQGPEQLITLDRLLPQLTGELLLLGDALIRYGAQLLAAPGAQCHVLPPALWMPQAATVCRLGALALAQGTAGDPHALAPRYLYSKESDITGW